MYWRNKIIYIISPQIWDSQKLSKHHFANELSKEAKKVFFIHSPSQSRTFKRGYPNITLVDSNIETVDIRLLFPLIWHDRYKWIYDFLIWFQIRVLIGRIKAPDIIISFDSCDYFPLKCFSNKATKIYFPVDDLHEKNGVKASNTSDLIVSVAKELIVGLEQKSTRKLVIGHGVEQAFFSHEVSKNNDAIRNVGYSGNLMHSSLDRTLIKHVVEAYPNLTFHFIGNIQQSRYDTKESMDFINFLKNQKNVCLYGRLDTEELASKLSKFDLLIVCYRVGISSYNSHKVLEYLALGKPVISTYLSFYDNDEQMLSMTSRNVNTYQDEFLTLFENLIACPKPLQKDELIKKRKAFAKKHLYSEQIKKIAAHLD
jgi:glycosyltransferase involved in cell wall biosynthesis